MLLLIHTLIINSTLNKKNRFILAELEVSDYY